MLRLYPFLCNLADAEMTLRKMVNQDFQDHSAGISNLSTSQYDISDAEMTLREIVSQGFRGDSGNSNFTTSQCKNKTKLCMDFTLQSPSKRDNHLIDTEYASFVHNRKKFRTKTLPGINCERKVPDLDSLRSRLVIVTAFSENHALEGFGMIASAQYFMPRQRIVIYDLGLEKKSLSKVSVSVFCLFVFLFLNFVEQM